jgi:hypothetical protein
VTRDRLRMAGVEIWDDHPQAVGVFRVVLRDRRVAEMAAAAAAAAAAMFNVRAPNQHTDRPRCELSSERLHIDQAASPQRRGYSQCGR